MAAVFLTSEVCYLATLQFADI